MLVSVFSDASVCEKTGACGIACWVKSNRIGKGKVFSQAIETWTVLPDQAEICAALFGLINAVNIGAAKSDDHVLLQSDCFAVRTFLKAPIDLYKKRGRDYDVELKGYYEQLLKDTGIRVYYRHVRGHSSENGRRFKVNKICDAMAKKEMKRTREIYVREAGLQCKETEVAKENQQHD